MTTNNAPFPDDDNQAHARNSVLEALRGADVYALVDGPLKSMEGLEGGTLLVTVSVASGHIATVAAKLADAGYRDQALDGNTIYISIPPQPLPGEIIWEIQPGPAC